MNNYRCYHALYPADMEKIGLKNNDKCDCGETGNLEHYFKSSQNIRYCLKNKNNFALTKLHACIWNRQNI